MPPEVDRETDMIGTAPAQVDYCNELDEQGWCDHREHKYDYDPTATLADLQASAAASTDETPDDRPGEDDPDTACETCQHGCACDVGTPGCEHFGCWGITDDATSNTCPGVPAARSALSALVAR